MRRWYLFFLVIAAAGCGKGKDKDSAEATAATSSSAACNSCDMDPNLDKPAAFKDKCEKGEPAACHFVGRMYENGTGGVSKDLGKARNYYAKACSGGFKPACDYAARAGKTE